MADSANEQEINEEVTPPQSLWALFAAFSWLAIQGFGAAAPVAYREIVERHRWIRPQEFAEDWAVAQLMPGPNAINLSLMVGDRFFGVRGAAASLAGMIFLPVLIAVTLATLYNAYSDHAAVASALKAMGAVAAGLIIGTSLKLLSSIDRAVLGTVTTIVLALAPFVAVGILRWPLIWVLLSLAVIGTCWTYRQLAKASALRSRGL